MYGNSSNYPPTLPLTLYIVHMQYLIQHKHDRVKIFVLFAANNHNVMHNDMSYVDIVDYVVSPLLGPQYLVQHKHDKVKILYMSYYFLFTTMHVMHNNSSM